MILWFGGGERVTARALACQGYLFDGWVSSGPVAGSNPALEFVVGSAIDLTPRFERATRISLLSGSPRSGGRSSDKAASHCVSASRSKQ